MAKHQNDRLQGTLDLLILKVIARSGSLHGYVIAQRIQQATDEYLRIEEGSLYPALHRMTNEKWLRKRSGAPAKRVGRQGFIRLPPRESGSLRKKSGVGLC